MTIHKSYYIFIKKRYTKRMFSELSAQVNRRGLSLIILLVFMSFMVGTSAQQNQEASLFGLFTVLNGILGGSIFLLHCSGNEDVRMKLVGFYRTIMKKDVEWYIIRLTTYPPFLKSYCNVPLIEYDYLYFENKYDKSICWRWFIWYTGTY